MFFRNGISGVLMIRIVALHIVLQIFYCFGHVLETQCSTFRIVHMTVNIDNVTTCSTMEYVFVELAVHQQSAVHYK